MGKYISLLVFFLLAVNITILGGDGKKYGQNITLTEKTKIASIIEAPDQFEGKKVLVEGTIVSVCAKRGCWIELASENEFEKIRVKVEDGEIVFPMEAKGKKALVEGEVYSMIIEGESGCGSDCGDAEHKDEKEKCEHEKKEVKKVYQIKGFGAVI